MTRDLDVERFKNADGVVELEAVARAAENRFWARMYAAITLVGAIVIIAVGVAAVVDVVDPQAAAQASLIMFGTSWLSGCRWVQCAQPDTPRARRAERLLPLALVPILLSLAVRLVF